MALVVRQASATVGGFSGPYSWPRHPSPDGPTSYATPSFYLWLNAEVPAPQGAERVGNSVEVLLRIYAKCLDGGDHVAHMRIDAALRDAS